MALREQLHKQIDSLPNEILQEISDFTMFVMTRRKISPSYLDWSDSQWQEFALEQFFRDEDDVEYTLKDAQEIYRP